jgi:cellobiose-specific phosphotransferase system component IIC
MLDANNIIHIFFVIYVFNYGCKLCFQNFVFSVRKFLINFIVYDPFTKVYDHFHNDYDQS